MKHSDWMNITTILIITALATGSLYYSHNVLASKDYELKAVGKGDVSCPDGIKVRNARISLFVFYHGKGIFAEWNVDQQDKGSTGGIITQQSISSSNYELEEKQVFYYICEDQVPVKVSFSGDCGEGSTVDLRASNGEKGMFNVRAQCTALQ